MAQPNVSELFESFDQGLLEAEWEAVNVEYPQVADKIQKLVSLGIAPKEISRRAVQIVGSTRTGMARRLENAAQYWQNQKPVGGVTVAGGSR